MRPNTTSSGIFSTNRNRPVSTSMLTRMLVPKPKKAFKSPAVNKFGRNSEVDVVALMARSPSSYSSRTRSGGRAGPQRREQRLRSGHRTENAALRLDHREACFVEFRKVGRAAVGQRDAAEAAVVGFTDSGVDADLGGHA